MRLCNFSAGAHTATPGRPTPHSSALSWNCCAARPCMREERCGRAAQVGWMNVWGGSGRAGAILRCVCGAPELVGIFALVWLHTQSACVRCRHTDSRHHKMANYSWDTRRLWSAWLFRVLLPAALARHSDFTLVVSSPRRCRIRRGRRVPAAALWLAERATTTLGPIHQQLNNKQTLPKIALRPCVGAPWMRWLASAVLAWCVCVCVGWRREEALSLDAGKAPLAPVSSSASSGAS